MPRETTHWNPVRFARLTDEQVGWAQHRMIDLGHRAADVAKSLRISMATIYKVKNCVPNALVEIDADTLERLRRRAKGKKRKLRRTA